MSPKLGGHASAPADLLRIASWGSAWSDAKMRATSQMLALRALANLFSTPAGRKTMAAAGESVLENLVNGRKWAEVGTAKQPLATVALK